MKDNKVLVISPHPDDESLGAGGTIFKYKNLGAQIYWLNFTDMKTEYGFSDDDVKRRTKEIQTVAGIYGFDGQFNLGLRPAGLSQYPEVELIQKTSEIVNEVQPNVVILPFKNDVHSDHRIVFNIVFSCTKSFRYPSIRKILSMEIPSETDFAVSSQGFIPNYFVDISDFLDRKIMACKTYASELKDHPFPRSEEGIRALATIRGSSAGCKYAEGFVLLKAIE